MLWISFSRPSIFRVHSNTTSTLGGRAWRHGENARAVRLVWGFLPASAMAVFFVCCCCDSGTIAKANHTEQSPDLSAFIYPWCRFCYVFFFFFFFSAWDSEQVLRGCYSLGSRNYIHLAFVFSLKFTTVSVSLWVEL